MKKFVNTLQSDKIIYRSSLVAGIFTIFALTVGGATYFFLPPVIPLFNQMPWGEGRLGIREAIFIPGVLSIAVYIINLFLSITAYDKMPLASRIIAVTTIFISIFAFLLTLRTALLVI